MQRQGIKRLHSSWLRPSLCWVLTEIYMTFVALISTTCPFVVARFGGHFYFHNWITRQDKRDGDGRAAATA